MFLLDKLLGRRIIPLISQQPDGRPYLHSREIQFSHQNRMVGIRKNWILIDTGARLCVVDLISMSEIAGVQLDVLYDYFERISQRYPNEHTKSVTAFGPPFRGPVYIRGFTGLGRWALFIPSVQVILGRVQYTIPIFTAQNARPIFGMPILQNVKLVLDGRRKKYIVL